MTAFSQHRQCNNPQEKKKKHTSLGQVETLLEEVGHQAKESDEAPESCTDNVEIGHGQSRHCWEQTDDYYTGQRRRWEQR